MVNKCCSTAADRRRPQHPALGNGHHPVSGPAWVALEHLLRNHGEIILADQVAGVVQQRRRSSDDRKLTIHLIGQAVAPVAE